MSTTIDIFIRVHRRAHAPPHNLINSTCPPQQQGEAASPELFFTSAEMFSALWDHHRDNGKEELTFMKRELLRLEKQSEHFINRIVETQSANLIVAYEGKIEKLQENKLVLEEKIKNCGRPHRGL